MKIIKKGIDAVELLRKELFKTKTFECKVCECVFEADKNEYKYVNTAYTCICPNCGEEVNANAD